MRTLLLELRPATLDEVPLTDLFRQLAEATHGRSGIDIDVDIETECDLDPDAKIAFYRIAQESLNNVAKHSGASRATVALAQLGDVVQLMIADDGRGFDSAEKTRREPGTQHHAGARGVGGRRPSRGELARRRNPGHAHVAGWLQGVLVLRDESTEGERNG